MSVDLKTGYDLVQPSVQQQIWHEIKRRRPRVIVSSPPCTLFSVLMRLWNAKRMKPEIRKQRMNDANVMYSFSLEAGKHQVARGQGYILEHPTLATSWKKAEVQAWLQSKEVALARFDQCRFGLVSPKKYPMKKATTLLHNIPAVGLAFHKRRCQCHGQKDLGMNKHRIIQGCENGIRLSSWAQHYPEPLVNTLARAIASFCASLQNNDN